MPAPGLGYFNPRSREGSDKTYAAISRNGAISIHAPVKGATGGSGAMGWNKLDFNPRSREGSDRLHQTHILCSNNFNPRSREGSDLLPELDEMA